MKNSHIGFIASQILRLIKGIIFSFSNIRFQFLEKSQKIYWARLEQHKLLTIWIKKEGYIEKTENTDFINYPFVISE